MTTIDLIRKALEWADEDTAHFAQDMRDAHFTQPTPRGGNHPLWVIGHLAHAEGGLSGMIHGEPNPVEQWTPLFVGGSEPTTNAADYPPFDEVFAKYREVRRRTMMLLDEVGEAGLDRAPKIVPPEVQEFFRTVGDVLLFIPMHQQRHLGQIADARRAAGRKPLQG